MASSSSKNHIDIDWSTPSTHSFVQLGTSTPRENSHYYVQDFEPEVILTSKDIFFIDIDDILPSSADTAHYPRRKNFPLLVSFKKFHLVDQSLNTNETQVVIHTNDYLMSTAPIRFTPSPNPRMAKRQTECFNRILKRNLKTKKGLPVNVPYTALPIIVNTDNIITNEINSQSPNYNVPNYNPIPDMFILHKYRNCIPTSPIYDENEEFLRQEAIRIQEQKNKQRQKLEQITAYHGTSTKYRYKRQFAPSQRYNKLPMVSRLFKEDELNLKDDSNAYVTYLFDSPYTSDDTKVIKARPLKRDTNSVQLISSPLDRTKRTCQDFSFTDSMVAGSSKNNFFVTQ
ncbi:hypothetical protein C1646_750266 [Rhizophagus diaphanus]|nr:hypothetical protein C1646_750266 [Rhizophagus diaphanus] [Rhizophagus sp. MUCL 43196]